MSPAEALTAATINAAYSLGLGDEVGSLEAGKQADFLIHEFTDYRELAYFIRCSSAAPGFHWRQGSALAGKKLERSSYAANDVCGAICAVSAVKMAIPSRS